MSVQEDLEKRKQAIAYHLTPYVDRSQHYLRVKDRFNQIEDIVKGCRDLERSPDGRAWIPEFPAGTEISRACGLAWAIQCLTGKSVRFMFNGIEIRMEDPLQ